MISQVNELTAIRKALYDLETAHGRVREGFEVEISKLKMELRVARQVQAEMQQRDREQRERELQQRGEAQQLGPRGIERGEQREVATPSQAPAVHGLQAQRPPPPPPPPIPAEHGMPLPPSHQHPAQQHIVQLGGAGPAATAANGGAKWDGESQWADDPRERKGERGAEHVL